MFNIVKYTFIGIIAIIFILLVGACVITVIPIIVIALYCLWLLLIPIGIATAFWGLGKIIVWFNKTNKMKNNNQGGN